MANTSIIFKNGLYFLDGDIGNKTLSRALNVNQPYMEFNRLKLWVLRDN
jgi:hypothetical protein